MGKREREAPKEEDDFRIHPFVVVRFDYPEKSRKAIINKYFVHRQFVSLPILGQKGSSARFMEAN